MERKQYIHNDLISLSEYKDDDCQLLFESWNETETIAGYNYKLPYTYQEYQEHCKESKPWNAIIMRLNDNVIIGRIGISSGLPDLTITIFKAYRGQGYGSMAFSLAARYCFETLGLEEIYAGCYEDNISSMNMIRSCGFVLHPEGNCTEKHIYTGKDRVQYDFILKNPNLNKLSVSPIVNMI